MIETSLNPAQQQVVDYGLLTSGFSCVLQMPTGSGKTWLAKKAIRDSVQRGWRALYLTPLRALAEELVSEWVKEFTGFKVGVFTGDYGRGGVAFPTPYRDARVLIMTPERLDVCTRTWRSHWNWIPEVDLVVVDEVHLLGDRGRGARLEGALSRLRRLNPFCRVLSSSRPNSGPSRSTGASPDTAKQTRNLKSFCRRPVLWLKPAARVWFSYKAGAERRPSLDS
jgi:helicase